MRRKGKTMTTYDLISESFHSRIPLGWSVPAIMIIGAILACIGEVIRGATGSRPGLLVAGHVLIVTGAAAFILFGAAGAVRIIAILAVACSGLRLFSSAVSPGSGDGVGVMRTKTMISLSAAVFAMLMCPVTTYSHMEMVADFYDQADDVIAASEQGEGPLNPAWLSPEAPITMVWVDRDPHKFSRDAWRFSGLTIGESVWRAMNQGRSAESAYEPAEWNLIEVSIPAIDGQQVRILCEYDAGTLFRSGYHLRNRANMGDSEHSRFAHFVCPEVFAPPSGEVISGEQHLAMMRSR